jgi:hypothetical protein
MNKQHPNDVALGFTHNRITSEMSFKGGGKASSKHNIIDSADFQLPTQASTDGTTVPDP